MSDTNQNPDFWRNKLLAFLHDPPHKALLLQQANHDHETPRDSFIRNVWPDFDPTAYRWFFDKVCDYIAAAADRMIFPKPAALIASFTGRDDAPFKHPLGGGHLVFEKELPTVAAAEKSLSEAQQRLLTDDWPAEWDEDQRNRARFFLHWRFWREYSADKQGHAGLPFLPADTRIPDHTIWTHNAVVSALQGCVRIQPGQKDFSEYREFQPTFLVMQFGPVQDFISQARTTRDLWSGSYLLSWLVAHAIKAITDQVGPDAILMPALCGQPLFDFLHKTDLYEKLDRWIEQREGKEVPLHSDEQILTPNMPNKILALVPEGKAEKLAIDARDAAFKELKENIGQVCWQWLMNANPHKLKTDEIPKAKARWEQQLDQFLTVNWQIWPWGEWGADGVEAAMAAFEKIPAGKFSDEGSSPAEALRTAHTVAIKGIPRDDLDPRNYRSQWRKVDARWKADIILDKDGLPIIDNPAFAWSAHYAMAEFHLAARRNTRDFDPWGRWDKDSNNNWTCLDREQREGAVKDMLSGKEEVIGSEGWQKELAGIEGHFFRENERLGAINLIKRVWPAVYLEQEKELNRIPHFDSVPAVAAAAWIRKTENRLTQPGPARDAFASAASGFGPLASHARSVFGGIKEWERHSEEKWLSDSDAAMFHPTEWERCVRESKEDAQKRELAQNAGRALSRLLVKEALNSKPPTYVAILAMDGDSMGAWVSGEKSPPWRKQLAKEALEYFSQDDARKRLLDLPRHVSPSYHLQLSECLANFSIYLAAAIVEHFDGQLIYSGGDDVLAMLPAAQALPCARVLRMAFQGDSQLSTIFDGAQALPQDHRGFVALNGDADIYRRIKRFIPRDHTRIVPGPRADISAGIAYGHMHAPLQNLVEAAHEALARAKRFKDKAAFAVTLFKRSGEVIEWGAKWDSRALPLMDAFLEHTNAGRLSSRFPYALARLLRPYACDEWREGSLRPWKIEATNGFDPFAVFPKEIEHAIEQHRQGEWKGKGSLPAREAFGKLMCAYLGVNGRHEGEHEESLSDGGMGVSPMRSDGQGLSSRCAQADSCSSMLASDNPVACDEALTCRGRHLDDFMGPFLTATFIKRGGEE